MSGRRLNLRSQAHFPTFAELPEDDDLDLDYYDEERSGVFGPIKHWCLLAEIVEPIPYLRPMFTVKDKTGKQFLVAMYLDNDVTLPDIWQKYGKPGNVMLIMYASRHIFVDGQIGIRVEEVGTVKMLPCSLNTLFGISNELNSPLTTCQYCKEPATLKCSSCSMLYCNKDCQKHDWKEHKSKCAAAKQVIEWRRRDWRKFDEYWLN
ncbi:hypothetical protein BYT27DRAFT_7143713 [Phlegmacium glaucopus]|nr:hypothetical protein BYT27DRAFT_7143713 [Phlegmacium glaucopus]